ncbi:hypothetical protein [Thiocystis violacea]|uniref:hypothetical protein n=1 Tax=Thiocystis violacea TaxID=13725 RepID=UPI0019044EAC|nr:hypothetical protein [Thiocystis violacea]
MTSNQERNPQPNRLILWGAQFGSVFVITVLTWWLPGLILVEPIDAARLPILAAGIVSVPLAILAARLLRARRPRSDVRVHEPVADPESPGKIGRYLVALAFAELPAILGLVYVLIGGDRLHSAALGTAAIMLLLTLWPGRPDATSG